MDQSSFIAAILLAGFILFLAAKNRLGTYTAVLWGNTSAPLPTVGGNSASGPIPWKDVNTAAQAAILAGP